MTSGKTKVKRKVKSDNFTILDNTFLQRSDMTSRAKGLLAYLLTLPDDWEVYKREIFRHHKEGYYAMDTAFKELQELGYINHFKVRDSKGRIKYWECEVYEVPDDNKKYKKIQKTRQFNPDRNFPHLDNPEQDNPKVGSPILGNQELLSTYSTNNLLNKVLDDDDINTKKQNFVNQKIINRLEQAGIEPVTEAKLQPFEEVMYQLVEEHHKDYKEAEEVILLAIEVYELNNGKSINYFISLFKDWEEQKLYTAADIQEYIDNYRNPFSKVEASDNAGPVPMINWLKELKGE